MTPDPSFCQATSETGVICTRPYSHKGSHQGVSRSVLGLADCVWEDGGSITTFTGGLRPSLGTASMTSGGAASSTITLVPNQPKTPRRTFRIPNELYEAAQAKAEAAGETVSDVVRRALEQYVGGKS